MIKYDRASVLPPAGLLRAGRRELARNLRAMQKNNALTFGAYKDGAVKLQLKALFGRKCVFCESLLMGTQPGDIEHYRPKGSLLVPNPAGAKPIEKAGYYWLAASWPNLLLACADCNRPRYQLDWDDTTRLIGKGEYFPLESEAQRATSTATLANEKPLLINPCSDDPERHLSFRDDGGVQPTIKDGVSSPEGQATIYYCGLARAELLQMRARHRITVMAAVRHIVQSLKAGNEPGADLDDLLLMLKPTEPYVAFTRHLVRTHLAPYLETLGLTV